MPVFPSSLHVSESARARSARWSLVFASAGHTYSHLFAPIFYIAVLSLEQKLHISHGQAVALIVVGNVLFGLAAPLAGWLGDKWSATGMMGIFFIGTGVGMVLTGATDTIWIITLGLALTGLFASIYHPVGMAWLVRHAVNRGTALGINGLFGGLGPALAAISAGVLIDTWGWGSAFVVPGVLVVLTGVAFYVLLQQGVILETKEDRKKDAPVARRDRVRAFVVLMVTMLCTGLIYQSTQPALPKLFSVRLLELTENGVLGISALVAVVYLMSGVMQVLAGRLADRYPLKYIYTICFTLQVPVLMLAASLSGTVLFVVAILMVTLNTASLPAENALVGRYAPSNWRGLAFGLKFILAFGVSGLGVLLEGKIFDATGDFFWLFVVLGAISVVGMTAGLLLPYEKHTPTPTPDVQSASQAAE